MWNVNLLYIDWVLSCTVSRHSNYFSVMKVNSVGDERYTVHITFVKEASLK